MNCSQPHKKLITLGFSVLVTLAFFAAAPQSYSADGVEPYLTNVVSATNAAGLSGAKNISIPQAVPSPTSAVPATAISTPPLSAAQLKKLMATFSQNGGEKEILPVTAEKLGIPSAHYRQISLLSKKSGNIYLLIILPNDELIVSYLDQTTAYSYRLDSNFKVLRSVAMTDNVPSEIKDPETDAKSILATWARFADKLPD